jgi:hypothetical protein
MAVFEHRKPDRLIWQPRLHYWYSVNKARETLPEKYEGWDLLAIYDDLDASPRAYHYFNDTIKVVEGDRVKKVEKSDGNYIYTKYETPKGNLVEVAKITEFGAASMKIEYLLKSVEDFDVLEYILRSQRFIFDKDLYEERIALLGDRSEPSITVPWGSIQRFFILYMGFQRGIIALWKHKENVENLLRVFDENDDERFALIRRTPFKLINFGDNIDEGLCSPPLFRRYMIPYYKRRTKELHQAGKYCTSHWDGKVKRLLPYIKETGLDGLECVPPLPQGNVTLEELKEALGDKILVDGIPAINFLPFVKKDELKTFVDNLLRIFSPNIIVGISDMLPPDGDIEKVRMISEMIKEHSP